METLIKESQSRRKKNPSKRRKPSTTVGGETVVVIADTREDEEEMVVEEDDPYEVKDDAFCYVSKAEYDASCRVSLHGGIRFDFERFERISRRAYPPSVGKGPRPPDYYQHEPVALFDAIAIATNLEAAARRAGSQIPYERLIIMENTDAARIVEQVANDGPMLAEVKASAEEFLFALMTVENATRHPPPLVRDLLLREVK